MPAASRRSRGARRSRWWMATTRARGPRTGATSSRSPLVATICAVRRSALVLTLGLVAGCALKGDVRKVELQVQTLQADVAKSDAARAARSEERRVGKECRSRWSPY